MLPSRVSRNILQYFEMCCCRLEGVPLRVCVRVPVWVRARGTPRVHLSGRPVAIDEQIDPPMLASCDIQIAVHDPGLSVRSIPRQDRSILAVVCGSP